MLLIRKMFDCSHTVCFACNGHVYSTFDSIMEDDIVSTETKK